MGYRQNIIVSSTLDKATREHALQSTLSRWTFLRRPRQSNVYSDRLLLALPELTDYLFDDEVDYVTALEHNGLVESELLSWSQEFSSTTFAYIEADCFGGIRGYSGFACRAGATLENVEPGEHAHVSLLRHVGIITDGPFEPFQRVFFEGRCSGERT